MADEPLLQVDDDGQYRFRDSEDDWEEKYVPAQGSKGRSGLKTVLFVTFVAVTCMLSLAYILSDWAKFMPSNTGDDHDHGHTETAPMDMGMNMGEMHDDSIPASSIAEIPIPVPTLIVSTTTSESSSSIPTLTTPVPNNAEKYILTNNWDYNAPPQRREYHWTVAEKELNPDGVFRQMILINEEYPGPLIECNEGDTIVVHVNNQGSNATAIHWHGMYQNGTNFMDGTVGITQCPIAPGGSFTYEYKIEGQSGTYWYHGHQGVQSADGLYGPIVVHSKDELTLQQLHYDTDRVVMLTDHYWDLSSELLLDYLKSDAENAEPVPMSALINGRGMRDCSKIQGRRCDNTTANVGVIPFDLESGKSHRLRFINTGAFAEFQVSVDEHEFAITEVDGTDVVPAYYHRMVINPAQRYSIILNNNNLSAGESFWLRAKMLQTCFAEPNPDLVTEIHAPVRWQEAGESANTAIPTSKDFYEVITLICKDLNTTELKPVIPMIAPEPTASLYFRVNFEIGGWQLSRGKFNQSSWSADVQHPTLYRAIDGYSAQDGAFLGQSANGTVSPAFINAEAFNSEKEMVLQSQGIQVLDIMLHNFDDGNHPLHLHGYKFFVLAQGHGYPPKNLSQTVDVSNPLRRDTASVEAYGWTLIRLVADNPGIWGFHCHISWHTEAGLLMQLLTRADEVARMEVPQDMRALCDAPLSELSKGMSPEDDYFAGTHEKREEGSAPKRFFSASVGTVLEV